MKSRFLFPNRFKVFGVLFSIPFMILGFYCLYKDYEVQWLTFNMPYYTEVIEDLRFKTKTVNFTNEIATIGLLISLNIIAFSKLKFEDEYISNIRLECLQIAIYVNFALLIVATLFIHGLAYINVIVFNIFTPLVIFILRFHYIIFIKKAQ
jgi:hypothetical protein